MKNNTCVYCGCDLGYMKDPEPGYEILGKREVLFHGLTIKPDKTIASHIWIGESPEELDAAECPNPECKKINAIPSFPPNKRFSDKINTYVDYVRSLNYENRKTN